MLETGFVTRSEYQKHIHGEWRTVHDLWRHIRNYMTSYAQPGGFTQGSIPFANATGFLTEDNPNLFWDAANARLGLNQITPTARIDIVAEADHPGINISAGAFGEMSTPDGEEFRWGHWNGADTFRERLKFDAAGIFYISYLVDHAVIFSGANGEIKQDVANFYWDNANKRLGIGKVPSNVLDVEGAGTAVGAPGAFTEVVARFRNDIAAEHTAIAIDALAGYDPILYLSENNLAIWDIRNDASETDEFQIRYQVDAANRIDFKIDNAGNVEITTGNLSIRSQNELRFYDNDNYVGFEAPALGANQIWVLPDADGAAGEAIVTDGGGNLSFASAGVSDFVSLTDTPANYAGSAGKVVVVNATPDALEFVDTLTLAGLTVTGILWYDHTDYNHIFGFECGIDLVGGGTDNIFMGYRSGYNITTGDLNFAAGHECLYLATTGSQNVAIGYRCLYGTAGEQGSQNVALGYEALKTCYGTGNFGLGVEAGEGITSGSYNVCIGTGAGKGMTITTQSVAIGQSAMGAGRGSYNVAIGAYSLEVCMGAYNTAAGRESGKSLVGGAYNCYFGRHVGFYNVGGSYNSFFGYQAGFGLGASGESCTNNVGIGAHALMSVGTSANNNVALGYKAGYHIAGGSGNVCLGYMAGETNLVGDSNELWIANSNTATPLIYGEFPNTLFRIQATNFNVIGTSNQGDGGVTNYVETKADGEINLHGTARVIKQIYLNNAAFTKGGTAPTQVILGNLNAWEFDIGDDAVMTSMLPPDWAAGTDITIKVCWYIDEAYVADKEIQWRVDWSALPHNFSEAVDAPTHSGQIDSGDINIPAVAKRMGLSTIGTIVAGDLSAHDMLGFTLSRIAVTNDDPTADPAIHHLIIEYTADKLGTAT